MAGTYIPLSRWPAVMRHVKLHDMAVRDVPSWPWPRRPKPSSAMTTAAICRMACSEVRGSHSLSHEAVRMVHKAGMAVERFERRGRRRGSLRPQTGRAAGPDWDRAADRLGSATASAPPASTAARISFVHNAPLVQDDHAERSYRGLLYQPALSPDGLQRPALVRGSAR